MTAIRIVTLALRDIIDSYGYRHSPLNIDTEATEERGAPIKIGEFHAQMVKGLPPGTVMQNPGGGETTITGYSNGSVSYVRGTSPIRVAIRDLFLAYSEFKGSQVSSRDLRLFAPGVFDSNARPAGHSCNCTFLFMVLRRLSMADPIAGDGERSVIIYLTQVTRRGYENSVNVWSKREYHSRHV